MNIPKWQLAQGLHALQNQRHFNNCAAMAGTLRQPDSSLCNKREPSKPEVNVVSQIQQSIVRMGARFDDSVFATTRTLYTQELLPVAEVQEYLDVPYGPHARHHLDVFARSGGSGKPVVVYVHGGGFIAGNKRGEGGFYENVGRFFASRGYVAVTINYRLAHEHAWPDAMRDVASALEWVVHHIADHGGDPARIGLIGHSAGASHAAGFLFDPQTSMQSARQVKAAVLLSGLYKVQAPLSAGQAAYFGQDQAAYEARSPGSHAASNPELPVLLAIAEYDPPHLAQQTLSFAGALTSSRGRCPPLHWFPAHNHTSTVMSLGTRQEDVGQHLCGFLDQHLVGER